MGVHLHGCPNSTRLGVPKRGVINSLRLRVCNYLTFVWNVSASLIVSTEANFDEKEGDKPSPDFKTSTCKK